MNLQIREFEQAIIRFINQSDLPMEVIRLAIKDVFYQVDNLANAAIDMEIQQKKEQEAQENLDETNDTQNQGEATE